MRKSTQLWQENKTKLIKLFKEKGITSCEIKLDKCWGKNYLSFAHRHKRKYYLDKPELIIEFNQVVSACPYCHNAIEDNKELTEQIFIKLRGQE